jgi:UDP-glucose 4-epimerase
VDRLADIQENIVCSTRLFEEAAKGGVKTIFFASSGGTVYGPYDRPISERDLPHPICAYGVSKLTTEHYLRLCCREFDVQGLALRFGNPYGRLQNDPNRMQGAIEVFLNRLIANEPIHIWGDGHIVRDYFHVQDLVAAVEGLANHKVQGFDVFNVGSGTGHSLLQILSLMAKITGLNPKISFMSPRAIDVPISILDISKLQNVTGWRPRVGLEEGIRKEWQRLWQNARNGKRG